MYDTKLADEILLKLSATFPGKLHLHDIRSLFPEHGSVPTKAWLLAVQALRVEGKIDGKFLEDGTELVDAAALYITERGRFGVRQPANRAASEADTKTQDTTASWVFISYSWESTEHKKWVHALATRLRADGIDAVIDQTHLQPGERSPEFMERSVRESASVLVICTPAYKQRFDNRHGGAGYEGHIITGEIIGEVGSNKFIPVLRDGNWIHAVPTALSGVHGIDLRNDSPDEYRRLVKCLYGIADIPPLGPRPEWLNLAFDSTKGQAPLGSAPANQAVMPRPAPDRDGILEELKDQEGWVTARNPHTEQFDRKKVTPIFTHNSLVGGRYRIWRLLAEGTRSEIYQAEDQALKCQIALKALKFDTPVDRRFTALEPNPYICRTFDLGYETSGGHLVTYVTMEFVEGETLADYLLRNGPLDRKSTLYVGRCVADAIDSAHAAGVMHGDLQPNKIMLRREYDGHWRPVITNFGLANITALGDENISRRSKYKAPEQFVGRGTHASDIFVLALIIFEMVVGNPYCGETQAGNGAPSPSKQPTDRSLTEAGCPARWSRAITRALQSESKKRYSSAIALIEDLVRQEG